VTELSSFFTPHVSSQVVETRSADRSRNVKKLFDTEPHSKTSISKLYLKLANRLNGKAPASRQSQLARRKWTLLMLVTFLGQTQEYYWCQKETPKARPIESLYHKTSAKRVTASGLAGARFCTESERASLNPTTSLTQYSIAEASSKTS
jgi:hypothetical protein